MSMPCPCRGDSCRGPPNRGAREFLEAHANPFTPLQS